MCIVSLNDWTCKNLYLPTFIHPSIYTYHTIPYHTISNNIISFHLISNHNISYSHYSYLTYRMKQIHYICICLKHMNFQHDHIISYTSWPITCQSLDVVRGAMNSSLAKCRQCRQASAWAVEQWGRGLANDECMSSVFVLMIYAEWFEHKWFCFWP